MSLIKFIYLLFNFLWRLIYKFFLCSSDPIDIVAAQQSYIVCKICKVLRGHNLNSPLPFLAIKTLYTLALFLLAYFTNNLLLVCILKLFYFLVSILLYFGSPRMGHFGFGCVGHIRRFDLIMFILHMRIQSCIRSVCFPTWLNRTHELFWNLFVFSTMNLWLVFMFTLFYILVWLVHLIIIINNNIKLETYSSLFDIINFETNNILQQMDK